MEIFEKHWKLLRKFCGNIMRRRFGWKKQLTKFIKFFYLLIEWPFELLGDLLFFWMRLGKKTLTNPRRILIVKIDQFGDVLFSTFLLSIIKKKYPDLEIDYLINPKTKPLLEKNSHIANIYFWEDPFLLSLMGREKNKTGGIVAVMKRNDAVLCELKKRHYDAVINTRAYPPSSNIPWRQLGGALIAFDISEQSFFADYWADYNLEEEEWKNYLNLLRPLGIDISHAEFCEEFYNNEAANLMNAMGSYVVISPVSFDVERTWKKGNWQQLITFLISQGFLVALTGMPSQKEYLEGLVSPANKDSVHILTDMKIQEFGALMKGATFFVGIDSFPAHLSLACNRQSIVLVNKDSYYIKGFSQKRFPTDARIMLPIVDTMKILDIEKTSVKDVETVIEKIVGKEEN